MSRAESIEQEDCRFFDRFPQNHRLPFLPFVSRDAESALLSAVEIFFPSRVEMMIAMDLTTREEFSDGSSASSSVIFLLFLGLFLFEITFSLEYVSYSFSCF